MKSIRKAYHPSLTVLVVEDVHLFVREIKHALLEHTVAVARSLEEAMRRYDECMPDLIFLDIDLPDGNGFELIDYIRSRDPKAYIVILTGSKLKEDVAAAEARGVRNYIIKPFTRAKIDQTVADYLKIREIEIASLLKQTQQHRQQALTEQRANNND